MLLDQSFLSKLKNVRNYYERMNDSNCEVSLAQVPTRHKFNNQENVQDFQYTRFRFYVRNTIKLNNSLLHQIYCIGFKAQSGIVPAKTGLTTCFLTFRSLLSLRVGYREIQLNNYWLMNDNIIQNTFDSKSQ